MTEGQQQVVAAVSDKVWRLTVQAPHELELQLIPLASGRLGGGWRVGLARWEAVDDQVRLLDEGGRARAVLTMPQDPDATLLAGSIVPEGHPCHLALVRPLPAPRTPTSCVPKPARRNLVILRAGVTSLHPVWLHDCPDEARTWDLCLCTYGPDPDAVFGPADRRLHVPGSKFQGLSEVFSKHDFWSAYDYVWLPDDDLLTDWRSINQLFEICRRYELALAQPALLPEGYINHPITVRAARSTLRFTTFVEIMAPLFSQAALRRVAATFALNTSGYGMDHLWPVLIDAPPHSIAIIDTVGVLHTRPVGSTYDQQGASQEGYAIEDAFHEINRYLVVGGIADKPAGYVRRHRQAGLLS